MTPYPAEPSPGVELLRDVPYGEAGGVTLFLHLALPRERTGAPLPAFVYMHGGAWESGSREDGVPAICWYAQHGYAAASVEYRLSGEAQYPAQIEDCKCAFNFLRTRAGEYGIDPERIGAMGASLGGHLAILLGLTSNRVAAVCDLFGVSDFMRMPKKHFPEAQSATARFLGGTIDEVPARYIEASPVNYVHPGAPPFLIVHGDADALVPTGQSELLHDALKKAGVEAELLMVKGAAHGSANVINLEVRAKILAFLDRHLKRPA